METDEFGKIRILDEFGGRFSGNAKPSLMDYDGDNKDELLIGTIRGDVEIFENPDQGLTDSLPSSGILLGYDVGGQAAPTAAVVDSTGSFSYVIGSSRGGLQLFNSLPADPGFSTSISKEVWRGPEIVVYPNPSKGMLKVAVEGEWEAPIILELFTAQGERLLSQPLNLPLMQIDLQAQPAGLYLLRFQSTQGTLVKKVVLMH
jgi:hypothetical protein